MLFKKHNSIFDILNIDTWDYASDSKEMIWNGNKLLNKDNKPLKEIDAVELARSIFRFLERNGEIIPPDKKISSIKNLLNRMENPEYYEQLYKKEQLEKDNAIPDGLFNPRDPETYKYAKSTRPLVIDGVQIFNTHIDSSGKEVKEDETEKGFTDVFSAMLKIHCKTQSEITAQEYIERHIRQKVAECSSKKTTKYGGYDFSEAQMEVLDGCSVEILRKIGKIMSADKGGGKLKQEIFNSLGIDGEWVVSLRDSSNYPDIEERIMHDYYLGFDDFSAKEEVIDFFNSRPYLEKRPELKQKVIDSVTDLMKDLQEAEEKYISIRKGSRVRMIERGTQIPDGWSLIE